MLPVAFFAVEFFINDEVRRVQLTNWRNIVINRLLFTAQIQNNNTVLSRKPKPPNKIYPRKQLDATKGTFLNMNHWNLWFIFRAGTSRCGCFSYKRGNDTRPRLKRTRNKVIRHGGFGLHARVRRWHHSRRHGRYSHHWRVGRLKDVTWLVGRREHTHALALFGVLVEGLLVVH